MKRINNSGPITPFIPEGVILDVDGLMLDTEELETGFYVEISGKMGWPTPSSILKNTVGRTDKDARGFYIKTYGEDYPYREIWTAVKDEETAYGEKNGLPHKKGLLVLLDKFKSLNIPLAVGTSNKRERALWKLEKAGILDRFTTLACGDEVEHSKPAPDVFLLAAKKLGLKPENCVGFEDSPAGLAGLAAAGIPSVFIQDMAEPPPEVLASVWYQCSDLEDAAALFG